MSREPMDGPVRDYEVGFAKPPRSGQFRKGVSGNPKGRPKGAKNLGTILNEMGRKKVKITKNGTTQTVTMLEAMVLQLLTRAAGGDISAVREVFAAHRIFVPAEPALDSQTDLHERDTAVMKNLVKRMRAFESDDNSGEDK